MSRLEYHRVFLICPPRCAYVTRVETKIKPRRCRKFLSLSSHPCRVALHYNETVGSLISRALIRVSELSMRKK